MAHATTLGPAAIDERRELAAVAAEFAARELRPRARLLDEGDDAAWRAAWGGCTGLGLDRALVAEEHGGAGLDAAAFCLILNAVAAGEAGVAYCLLAHNLALVTLPAGELPGVGERWVVSVPPLEMPDPGVVLGAAGAQGAVIFGGRDAAGNGPSGMALAVVLGSGGATCEPLVEQLGLRAAPAGTLRLDAATARSLDGPAEAPAECRTLLLRGIAAIAAGVARDAFERAYEYAQQRHQSGGPIARFDAVKELLARLRLAADLGSAAIECAPSDARAHALAAKIAVTDATLAAAIDAVQVFGGYGYMVEQGVEKLMRDAEYLRLIPEPNRVARLALGGTA